MDTQIDEKGLDTVLEAYTGEVLTRLPVYRKGGGRKSDLNPSAMSLLNMELETTMKRLGWQVSITLFEDAVTGYRPCDWISITAGRRETPNRIKEWGPCLAQHAWAQAYNDTAGQFLGEKI